MAKYVVTLLIVFLLSCGACGEKEIAPRQDSDSAGDTGSPDDETEDSNPGPSNTTIRRIIKKVVKLLF